VDEELGRWIADIEERLDRLERVIFTLHTDIRRLADYGYMNVRLDVQPDQIKRLTGMETLQDRDAVKLGMTMPQLVLLKRAYARLIQPQSRMDVIAIARSLIQPRVRPAAVEEDLAAGPTNPLASQRRTAKRRNAAAKTDEEVADAVL
jgi:hypothetical protein